MLLLSERSELSWESFEELELPEFEEELLEELKTAGFSRVRLAYQKANPQSTRFWTKNGFQPVEEKPHPYGTMLVAVRNLSFSENPC